MTDTTNKRKGGWWALSPLAVFLCLYLVTSLIVNDFYKVPITVAFLLSSCYAIVLTRGLSLEKRVYQFSVGASNKNIILMIWIFILAGAFAQSAKQMGAIDATVNLTLSILPDNLLLAGIFIAACFISLSIGTSVGTIVALTPVAIGLAEKTGIDLLYMVAIVVGGSFFGDNLSFISDTTIASTKTQDCVMRDKFRVNFMIVVPAALIVLCIYIFQGLSITAPAQTQEIEWIKVIPYLIVLGTAVAGVNVMLVLLLGILSTGIIGIFTSGTDLSSASLPVVTMGTSCAALYQVLGKLIAGEDGHVARQLFRAWGENWKKATPVWLILLAVAALCGFDLYMARLNDSFLWELLAVFALQLAAMVMTFAFPLMAQYENTWRNHLKNAMLVAVGHLPRMLLIWAVWAVPVGVSVFIPEVGFYLSIVWVLIGYSSLSYVTALLLRPVFRNLDENA